MKGYIGRGGASGSVVICWCWDILSQQTGLERGRFKEERKGVERIVKLAI